MQITSTYHPASGHLLPVAGLSKATEYRLDIARGWKPALSLPTLIVDRQWADESCSGMLLPEISDQLPVQTALVDTIGSRKVSYAQPKRVDGARGGLHG